VSYVKLKHTLSAIALDAIRHPEGAPVADALLAYARAGRDGHRVPLASLARSAGIAPDDVRQVLKETGLFEEFDHADRDHASLAAPFRPFVPYLRRQSARTAVALRLLRAPHAEGIPEEIWRAAALFNAGLFFECHEYLEDVWRAASPPERAFYHGLVQAAAGFYHLEKANVHGARTLVQKAVAKLGTYSPVHREVDVAAFVAGLRRVLAQMDPATGSADPARVALPTLDLVDSPRARRRRVRVCAIQAATRAPRPPGPSP
jgi:uncharacterized protein